MKPCVDEAHAFTSCGSTALPREPKVAGEHWRAGCTRCNVSNELCLPAGGGSGDRAKRRRLGGEGAMGSSPHGAHVKRSWAWGQVNHRSSSMSDGGSHLCWRLPTPPRRRLLVAPPSLAAIDPTCDAQDPVPLPRAWLLPSCCRSLPQASRAQPTCPCCRRRLSRTALPTPTRTLRCDTSSTTAPTNIPSCTGDSTCQSMPQYGPSTTTTRPVASLCRGCASSPRP